MRSFLFTLGIVMLAWLWSAATRSKGQATAFCAKACREIDLQFLDQTVVLSKLGIGRGRNNWPQWQRVYNFEFSVNGDARHSGQLALHGNRIAAVHLDHPDGAIILQPDQPPQR